MKKIKIYLAHYNSTLFFEMQVKLFRKYLIGGNVEYYGFVDSNNENMRIKMREEWKRLGVNPIYLPSNRSNNASESLGLAFNFVYNNYIKNDEYISIFIENDVFPIKEINIVELCKDKAICGELRFHDKHMPDKILHFWLGFLVFNNEKMVDKDLIDGRVVHITSMETGKTYWIDCGGLTYYWVMKNINLIKQITTVGSEKNYDPIIAKTCQVHNITTDIDNLPEYMRENYKSEFRVLIYNDMLLHLEQLGKYSQYQVEKMEKYKWWLTIYKKLI